MFDAGFVDTMVRDGLTDAFHDIHMGITAENICDEYGITREELDAFALKSQMKTAAAQACGRFEAEIVPVEVRQKKQTLLFSRDEFPRNNSTPEGLAKLSPAFRKEGRVTAGNSSGVNDGAAALVLASGEAVRRLGLKPMARLVSWGTGRRGSESHGPGPRPGEQSGAAKGRPDGERHGPDRGQ